MHWNRQRWGRKRQAKVAGLQKHGTLLCLSQILIPSDPSTIEASNFQTDRKTRFIIHGFIGKGDESWLVDMCKVGPGSNPSGLRCGQLPLLPTNVSTSLYAISISEFGTGNPDVSRYLYAIKMPLHQNKNPLPSF